ncbi:ankyrin repeat domain-containing protein [bacterium]|nr:ankyrin repeat domain-containing protein [bacterium]
MLEEQPTLVNATWDWGGGDWETSLGGASHMGRRDIALFLLENNARVDIFAAAMLGQLEIVKEAAFPAIHKVPGPHEIPLIAHAPKGGEHAAEVLKYLESLNPA